MRKAFLAAAMVIVACSAAFAQESADLPKPSNEMGTPQQRAACRPDVRKFCRSVPENAGPFAFLACLQQHREKLSRGCRGVLESAGQ